MIWHNSSADEVIAELGSDKLNGLTSLEAAKRIREFGKNKFHTANNKNIFVYILNEFTTVPTMFLLLLAVIYWILASVLDLNTWLNSLVIILITLLIVFLTGVIKYITQIHNEKLKNGLSTKVTVIRDKKELLINKEQLVPGDIMLLKSGDYIMADARLIDAYVLKCDEFFVTGETVPVDKLPETIFEDITPISKRSNMIYCGSVVVNGKAIAVVTETAQATAIGSQKDLAFSVDTSESVFTAKLEQVRKVFNNTALVLFAIVFVLGILVNFFSTQNFANIVSYHLFLGLAGYVASFTYAIPTLLTLATSLSTFRLKRAGVLVKSPETMEQLKDVSVICADKTGTLTTENLRVVKVFGGIETVDLANTHCDESAAAVLRLALICTNFSEHSQRHSNKVENAIEAACIEHIGASKADIEGMFPTLVELPFNSERRVMTAVTVINGNPVAIIKGAPEIILSRCTDINLEETEKIVNEYAKSGLKVMAVAIKQLDEIPANPNSEELENELTFTGIIGFEDQIDAHAAKHCLDCVRAGIRVIMVTGDHIDTAVTTAMKLGILTDESAAISSEQLAEYTDKELAENIQNYSVFARITPEDKRRIVSILRQLGEKVLVTGDIINDTPALLEANVGCALGKTAEDIVKDTSELIIGDNRFSSIIRSIKESGAIFYNIKKCLGYYITYNLTVVATIILGLLISGKSPLTVASLMLLSLLSLALPCFGFLTQGGKMELNVAHKASITFNKAFLAKIITPAIIVPIFASIGFALTLKNGETVANGVAFSVLALSFVAQVFSLSFPKVILLKPVFTSYMLPIICGLGLFVYFINILTPVGTLLLIDTQPLLGWILSLVSTLLVFAVSEIFKLVKQ